MSSVPALLLGQFSPLFHDLMLHVYQWDTMDIVSIVSYCIHGLQVDSNYPFKT